MNRREFSRIAGALPFAGSAVVDSPFWGRTSWKYVEEPPEVLIPIPPAEPYRVLAFMFEYPDAPGPSFDLVTTSDCLTIKVPQLRPPSDITIGEAMPIPNRSAPIFSIDYIRTDVDVQISEEYAAIVNPEGLPVVAFLRITPNP